MTIFLSAWDDYRDFGPEQTGERCYTSYEFCEAVTICEPVYSDPPAVDVRGRPGDDTIYGSLYADTIGGGQGDDRLYGRWGDDTLRGWSGDDTLTGGHGADAFVFDRCPETAGDAGRVGDDVVKDFEPGIDRVEWGAGLVGVERRAFQDGPDAVVELGDGLGSITFLDTSAADLEALT